MKMDQPRVATIIPTMNRPDRLSRALESVEAQTWRPLEIVVVDDSDTDHSKQVVNSFKNRCSVEVSYIRNETPQGPASARNLGIEATSAPLLAFLDDDDIWHSNKIERQVQCLKSTSCSVGGVYCGRRTVDQSGTHRNTLRPTVEGDLYKDLLVRDVVGSPSKVLVRRSAAEKVGGFDEDIGYHEDWDFNLRLAKQYKWRCVSDALLTRTVHEDIRSRDINQKIESRETILSRNSAELERVGKTGAAWHYHYREAGIDYCSAGKTSEGSKMIRKALKSKWAWDTALLYCIARTGPLGFYTLLKIKRNIPISVAG